MARPILPNARRSSPGSWLDRRAERRRLRPGEFVCAVRVLSGAAPGETAKWSYRRTVVEQISPVVVLNHGSPTSKLHLRFSGEQHPGGRGVREYHVVWPATEVVTGAELELAADIGEAARLGIEPGIQDDHL